MLALLVVAAPAFAVDGEAQASVAQRSERVAASAKAFAESAKVSDDPSVTSRLAPRASALANELRALSQRVRQGAAFDGLAKDLRGFEKQATELVGLTDSATDESERTALHLEAQVLEREVVALREQVALLAPGLVTSARPTVIAAAPLSRLLEAVKRAESDRARVVLLQKAAAENAFSAAQVALVIAPFSHDEGRVEGAAACWPSVVDPENQSLIFAKFDSDSGSERLRQRIRAK